ncbi:hypothetical protein EN873_39005 [bacterium M00.F.Ca.ET.230.01.1.1]|nr:hypothetical protein EN873_39005 [bacterium M00.F.Ca.ET.230.01.1.1]
MSIGAFVAADRRCEGFHGSGGAAAALCRRSATSRGGSMTPANINLLHGVTIWHATRWRRAAVFMAYSPHREMAASQRLLFIAIFDKWSGTMPFSRPFVTEW